MEIGFCPVADTSPNVDFQDTLQLIVSEETSTFDLKKDHRLPKLPSKVNKKTKESYLLGQIKKGKMKVFSLLL